MDWDKINAFNATFGLLSYFLRDCSDFYTGKEVLIWLVCFYSTLTKLFLDTYILITFYFQLDIWPLVSQPISYMG